LSSIKRNSRRDLSDAIKRGDYPSWSLKVQNGVCEPVLQRAFEYWRNIDKETGDRIAKGVKGG